MKIRISNFLEARNQIILSVNDYSFTEFTDLKKEDNLYSITSRGFYISKEEGIVMFFCVNKDLYIYLNYSFFKLDSNNSVQFEQRNEAKRLSLFNKEKLVTCFEYKDDFVVVSTLLYSEEEEDANFGLWIANIVNNKERKTIFMANNCS